MLASRQPWAIPTQPAARDIRPLSSADIATANPSPSPPRRWASGTPTPSRCSSAVFWARSPSFPVTGRASNPGASVGTRKAVTPFGPGPPVRANTSATPAQPPLVMNILEPLIRQAPSSPSRSARDSSAAASDPWPGSVSAKHPRASPEHNRGSHARFCSSVPHSSTVLATSPTFTEITPRTLESAFPISSTTRQYDRLSRPIPPYASGIGAPRNPTAARSMRSSRSHSRANGAISRSANSRAVRRTISCSGVSSKSTSETSAADPGHQIGRDVGDRRAPGDGHGDVELGAQQRQDPPDDVLPAHRQPPQDGPPQQHGPRPDRQRLQHVGAPPPAPVHHDLDRAPHRLPP